MNPKHSDLLTALSLFVNKTSSVNSYISACERDFKTRYTILSSYALEVLLCL